MDTVFSRSIVKTFTKKLFYRPYPLILGLISGFSVFYFLYLFGAYGIQKGLSHSGHSHLFRSIIFGLLTFTYLITFETWIKPKLNLTRLSQSIFWYVSLLLIGSQLIFLLFNFFWNWQEWNVEAYLLIVKEFPLLTALPLSFYLALKALIKPNIIKEDYEETGQWHQNLFIDLSLGRRVFSTASDLNRWAQAMDNPGWLKAESLKLMQQNHLAEIDTNFSYGYGWVILDGENISRMVDLGIKQPYIIHGGSTEGYKAMLININRGEYVISFYSNVGNRTEEIQLAQQIVNILIK